MTNRFRLFGRCGVLAAGTFAMALMAVNAAHAGSSGASDNPFANIMPITQEKLPHPSCDKSKGACSEPGAASAGTSPTAKSDAHLDGHQGPPLRNWPLPPTTQGSDCMQFHSDGTVSRGAWDPAKGHCVYHDAGPFHRTAPSGETVPHAKFN